MEMQVNSEYTKLRHTHTLSVSCQCFMPRFANRTKGPFMSNRRIWLFATHDTNVPNVLDALDTQVRVSANSMMHQIL